MKPIQFSAPIDLRAAAGKPRRFRIEAYNGGPLQVAGFPLPVIVDLRGIDTSTPVPILVDHQATVEATLGQTDTIQNTGRNLTLAGPVTGVSAMSRQVLAQSAAGHQWQASIGAMVLESEDIAAGQKVNVNGQTFVGPVIVARQSVLRETSVLPIGADKTTTVNLAAKQAANLKGNAMDFETWVASLGLDPATLSPEAKAALMLSYDAQQQAPADGVPAAAGAVLNLRAAAAADARRIAEISAKCHGHPMILAAAIEKGWSTLEAENAVLRAQAIQRTPSNFIRGSAGGGVSKNMLCASLLLRAGQEKVAVKAYGEQTVQQAHDARITNFRDLCAAALTMSGQDRREFSGDTEMIRAAFSTVHLPNILSDVVNRTLVAAYEETTTDWRLFCNIGSAPDFRDQKDIRPTALENLQQLGVGGIIKNQGLTEEATYTWSVDTFARMLSVTRRDIVNDDLGFISSLSPAFGVAAGRSLNDLIWSTIMGGQTAGFFASGNGNLAEAGSALAVGTLGAGVAAMRNQLDSKNFNIGVKPAVLVVPPTLELTARPLLNSAELLGLTTGTTPSGNPVVNIVPNLAVESRLENSARFTGTSAASWYLFGPPSSKPVTVGFLDGVQTPTVETSDSDFNTLGMQMRCYFDYGVALSDPKAGYKATGAGGG